ncbi:hypothetical protein [Ornithinimicrobium murale]|uniref:hypothetical protein n=1 Tax=Ornithinimicrobium murale TaxID=1050153 RepID=UPI0013B43636|nr:hypothetical protein [Ornithinimicrobium murale]
MRTTLAAIRAEAEVDERRREALAALWRQSPVSDEEAQDLLRLVGTGLSSRTGLPQEGHEPQLEIAVVQLCVYFNSRRVVPTEAHLSFARIWADGAVPGKASRAIRRAQIVEQHDFRVRLDLSDFGRFLVTHAEQLSSSNIHDRFALMDSGIIGKLKDSNLMDSCSSEPIELRESISRLHTYIRNASLSPKAHHEYAAGVAVAAAVLILLLTGNLATLGVRDNLAGPGSVVASMICLLIASVGAGAAIRETTVYRLGAYGMARAKTLNRCSVALLAFSTILLGAGLSSGTSENTNSVDVYGALFVYGATVVTTIAAEHMISTAEARIRVTAPKGSLPRATREHARCIHRTTRERPTTRKPDCPRS